jgi:hypothetical protein
MTEGSSYCVECKRPLVEIDNRGHRLRGCLTCNVWHDSDGNVVKLSVEIWLRCMRCGDNKEAPSRELRGFFTRPCAGWKVWFTNQPYRRRFQAAASFFHSGRQ